MNKILRLAGAQIPCGKNIQINKKEILKALDWAKENEVDCILTPEGSLSGYETNWQVKISELNDALIEVEEHQKKLGVGLHLGTGFYEREYFGEVFRNQIRHYNKDGKLLGCTNKTLTLDSEGVLPRSPSKEHIISVPLMETPFLENIPEIHVMGMVCNDMWGAHNREQTSILPMVNYFLEYRPQIQLIFHSTNGRKMNSDDLMHKVYWDWHNSVLRLNATFAFPILTVDSCSSWQWDGDEEWIDKFPTSSQSGFIDYSGWKTDVPRYGRQYFYHDYDVSSRFEYFLDQKENLALG